MPKHHETRFLPYSAPQLFDLVSDIESYPEFLPWCKSAHILSREDGATKSEGRVMADLVIGYKIFQEKFTSEVLFDRPRMIAVTYRSGPLSRLSNEWHFAPKGRKGCDLSFMVDFDFHSPLLRAAMNVFFDRALTKMVAAFEARAAQLYG